MNKNAFNMIVRRSSPVILGLALVSTAWAAKRPNIIIAMADDMGWSDQLAVFDRGEFEAAARETAGEVNTTLCLEGRSSIRFGCRSDPRMATNTTRRRHGKSDLYLL